MVSMGGGAAAQGARAKNQCKGEHSTQPHHKYIA
jgi:hypothetical protein